MNCPAVVLISLTAAVEALAASTPARRRRFPTSAAALGIRTLISGLKRAFEWYVEHFLDFAPLMDVLGHTSASASLHTVTMRSKDDPSRSSQGEAHD
jgi:hypothetical protein